MDSEDLEASAGVVGKVAATEDEAAVGNSELLSEVGMGMCHELGSRLAWPFLVPGAQMSERAREHARALTLGTRAPVIPTSCNGSAAGQSIPRNDSIKGENVGGDVERFYSFHQVEGAAGVTLGPGQECLRSEHIVEKQVCANVSKISAEELVRA